MTRYIILLGVGLLSCQPASATDREHQRREHGEVLSESARIGQRADMMASVTRAFAARFEGQLLPGVGCDVCPDMCRRADLRALPIPMFRRLYREAAMQHGYPDHDWGYQLASLELSRLGCVARGGEPEMQQAWVRLLDSHEDPAVRYFAAVQAIEIGFATEEPRRVLLELAGGASKFALPASVRIQEWEIGIEPQL